jgi:sugar phosphate isomerase/epimerase
MIHALSTHLFVGHRLTTVWLERIWEAGIPLVEIFCARQHFDYRNTAQAAELGHWFRDSDLKLHSIHAPMYSDDCWGRTGPSAVVNIAETEKIRRVAAVDEIKHAIDFAEYVPYRYVIQHLGVGGEEHGDHKLDAAFQALEELKLFAGYRGVEILLENTPNGMSSAERLHWFLEQTHLGLNLCFDTGHAHMNEGVAAAFDRMQDRIRSTHIHDNDGENDIHLFPLHAAGGSIDWTRTMSLLRSRGEQYPLLLELREVPDMDRPLQVVREVFEKLENV